MTLACGLTNYAHPLGLAALNSVIELLHDAQFQENKSRLERLLSDRLDQLQHHEGIKEIRCQGLLAAVEFHSSAPPWRRFLDDGLYLVVVPKEKTVVVAPPLTTAPSRLAVALDTLSATIDGHVRDELVTKSD